MVAFEEPMYQIHPVSRSCCYLQLFLVCMAVYVHKDGHVCALFLNLSSFHTVSYTLLHIQVRCLSFYCQWMCATGVYLASPKRDKRTAISFSLCAMAGSSSLSCCEQYCSSLAALLLRILLGCSQDITTWTFIKGTATHLNVYWKTQTQKGVCMYHGKIEDMPSLQYNQWRKERSRADCFT